METKRWRAKEGEIYYYISNCTLDVVEEKDCAYEALDRWCVGNYFQTKEEAKAMARKIRAVLKGADVIEMPSDDETDAKKKELYPKEYNAYTGYYETPEQIEGFWDCYEWLKSKIVK